MQCSDCWFCVSIGGLRLKVIANNSAIGSIWMSEEKIDRGRRRFLTAATSVIGGVGALYAVVPFVGSWFPTAKAEALGAPVEVNLAKVKPGAQLTVEWRGQPVWIIKFMPVALLYGQCPGARFLIGYSKEPNG